MSLTAWLLRSVQADDFLEVIVTVLLRFGKCDAHLVELLFVVGGVGLGGFHGGHGIAFLLFQLCPTGFLAFEVLPDKIDFGLEFADDLLLGSLVGSRFLSLLLRARP